jgi:hypothetical protein
MSILLILGTIVSFILPPVLSVVDPDTVWPFFQDSLGIKDENARFQSAFPIFPWVGYALFGGAIGAVMRDKPRLVEDRNFGFYLLVLSVFLHFIPYLLLMSLEAGFRSMGFPTIMGQSYEFARLGRVIAVVGIIALLLEYRVEIAAFCKRRLSFFFSIWFLAGFLGIALLLASGLVGQYHFAPRFTLTGLGHILVFLALALIAARVVPWNFELFLKIGQYTLPVYVVHVIVLYAGIFGFGLNRYIRYTMEPWMAIGSAVVFILAFVYLVKYIEYFQWSYYLKKREKQGTDHAETS